MIIEAWEVNLPQKEFPVYQYRITVQNPEHFHNAAFAWIRTKDFNTDVTIYQPALILSCNGNWVYVASTYNIQMNLNFSPIDLLRSDYIDCP